MPIDRDLKAFLDEKVLEYNVPAFVEADPVSIPHRYSLKEDIEIAAFLAATISWGSRSVIVQNGHRMLDLLGESPYDFVMDHDEARLERLTGFVHRTFNEVDFQFFILGLRHIYTRHGGLEGVFSRHAAADSLQPAISAFKQLFFEIPHPARTAKHVSDPLAGSSAKRINMMLRWLVRDDRCGVDLGIWKKIRPAQLSCPLDVHSGNVARKFGLLQRRQNDARAVAELDQVLRRLDPADPVRYDFALFGLGVFEKF